MSNNNLNIISPNLAKDFLLGFDIKNFAKNPVDTILFLKDKTLINVLLDKVKIVHKSITQHKRSLVVVSSILTFDDISDQINLAPTIKEAEDIIALEKIMRDFDET